MIQASAAVAAGDAPGRLIAPCLQRVLAARSGFPALVVVFTAGQDPADAPALLAEVRAAAPGAVVVGCDAAGVLGIGEAGSGRIEPVEVEGEPGLALLALWGGADELGLAPVLARDLDRDPAGAGEAVGAAARALFQTAPGEGRAVMLLPDAYVLRAGDLLGGVAAGLAGVPVPVVGAAAAAIAPVATIGKGPPGALVWAGDSATHAAAGLALAGRFAVHVAVAQGCRPVSPWRRVTRSRGNVVMEIDGAPAFQAFVEVARGPLGDDLPRAARSIMVGLPAEEGARAAGVRALPVSATAAPGHGALQGERPYVVRGIAGFEPDKGWLGLGHPVPAGTPIRFVLREPTGAREALTRACTELLAEIGQKRPIFGLYFNCAGRGRGLYGMPGHDLAYIARAFGELPLVGVFGGAEIGPARTSSDAPALHLFSGVLAVFTDE